MTAEDRRWVRPAGTSAIDVQLERDVRSTAQIRGVFYAVVLLTALGGQASGAVEVFEIHPLIAVPIVGALELGGMVWLRNSEVRRRLGETALISRIGSAVIAIGAAAWCWTSHSDHRWGAFFAGMSLLGYGTYLMSSENKRRDRLRAKGQMEAPAPVYGLFQWLTHPWLTRRARLLAMASAAKRAAEINLARDRNEHPAISTEVLGRMASLAAAREQVRAERREAGLAKAVEERIEKTAGKGMAKIAVATYDMEEIAKRLKRTADYDGIAALLGRELTADKLAGIPAFEQAAMSDDASRTLRVDASVGTPVDATLTRQETPEVTRHDASALPSGDATGDAPVTRQIASGDASREASGDEAAASTKTQRGGRPKSREAKIGRAIELMDLEEMSARAAAQKVGIDPRAVQRRVNKALNGKSPHLSD